jgi:hypothetical protein
MKHARLIRGVGVALHIARIAWLVWLAWFTGTRLNGFALFAIGWLVLAVCIAIGLAVWLTKGRWEVVLVADSMLLVSEVLLPLESAALLFSLPPQAPIWAYSVAILPQVLTTIMCLTAAADSRRPTAAEVWSG